ncbi:MAG: hypothetical protein ACHQQS_15700 [Thermoanaerobaculales bacterium]
MKRAGAGGFSAVCRAAGASRAATRTDPGALVGVKRHVLLELQWQGRGGQFRHVVLYRRGLRRVLGTSGIVVLSALAVIGAFSVGSNRALAHFSVDTILNENTELKARQDTLRGRAFELARALGIGMPETVEILAVEGGEMRTLGEEMTPPVAAAVRPLARTVLRTVTRWVRSPSRAPRQRSTPSAAPVVPTPAQRKRRRS